MLLLISKVMRFLYSFSLVLNIMIPFILAAGSGSFHGQASELDPNWSESAALHPRKQKFLNFQLCLLQVIQLIIYKYLRDCIINCSPLFVQNPYNLSIKINSFRYNLRTRNEQQFRNIGHRVATFYVLGFEEGVRGPRGEALLYALHGQGNHLCIYHMTARPVLKGTFQQKMTFTAIIAPFTPFMNLLLIFRSDAWFPYNPGFCEK